MLRFLNRIIHEVETSLRPFRFSRGSARGAYVNLVVLADLILNRSPATRSVYAASLDVAWAIGTVPRGGLTSTLSGLGIYSSLAKFFLGLVFRGVI